MFVGIFQERSRPTIVRNDQSDGCHYPLSLLDRYVTDTVPIRLPTCSDHWQEGHCCGHRVESLEPPHQQARPAVMSSSRSWKETYHSPLHHGCATWSSCNCFGHRCPVDASPWWSAYASILAATSARRPHRRAENCRLTLWPHLPIGTPAAATLL